VQHFRFYLIVIFFAIGIILGLKVGFSIYLFYLSSLFIFICGFLLFIYQDKGSRDVIKLIIFIFVLCALGILRASVFSLASSSHIDEFLGQNILIEGVILSERDVRDNNVHLILNIEHRQHDLSY
jgi:hypothetical protein